MNTKLLLGLGSAVLVGMFAVSGLAYASSAAQEGAPRGARVERQERDGRGLRQRVVKRMRQRRDFLRSLEITEVQRESARAAARELAPLAETLRPQVKALLERARALRRACDREGARKVLENELKPLLASAKPQTQRAVAPLVGSLTPEQRAKLEAAAQRRGRSFDEQRFAHRLGLALSSRRGQERARDERRPR
ncbi:MAG: hypothetical protein JNN27_07730 [Planctomycetes bacterium]|nr:hypothetical protein [Planctomycetota bacterium]